MDYKSFIARIEVNDGFTCPYCGAKIDTLNIMFARYVPGEQKILFGFGGCCAAANDSLFELPANTAFSYAALPSVMDVIKAKLDERRDAMPSHDAVTDCNA